MFTPIEWLIFLVAAVLCIVEAYRAGDRFHYHLNKGRLTWPKVNYGVHSEVGKLRKVMVCAPGRAHRRDAHQLRRLAFRRRPVGR